MWPLSSLLLWIAKNKSIPLLCAVPGGLTVMEHNAWIQFGSGQELWNEIYSEFGLRAFMAGNTGVQMGGWLQKEIDLRADFRGLKIRIPGLAPKS